MSGMQSTRLWIPVVPKIMVLALMLVSAWGERGIMAEAVVRAAGMAMRSLMGFGILRIAAVMGFRDG